MYLFNALTQKHIMVAQQLIGASRASSQDMVSTVVGHSHPNSSAPTLLSATLRSIALSSNHQALHYSHSHPQRYFSNIMFSVCLFQHSKKSIISIKDLVLFYVMKPITVLFPAIVTLHRPHLFHPQTQACSKFNFSPSKAYFTPVLPLLLLPFSSS